MNIRIYWKNGDLDSIDTTVLSSADATTGSSPDEGPGACALWRDRVVLHDWESSGIVLQRSYCGWHDAGECSMVRELEDGGSYEMCDYQVASAERLRSEAREVWVDGVALLLTDPEGELRPAYEVEEERRGQEWR